MLVADLPQNLVAEIPRQEQDNVRPASERRRRWHDEDVRARRVVVVLKLSAIRDDLEVPMIDAAIVEQRRATRRRSVADDAFSFGAFFHDRLTQHRAVAFTTAGKLTPRPGPRDIQSGFLLDHLCERPPVPATRFCVIYNQPSSPHP